MNALKHGLRAREFGLLPEESQTEWAEHLADLRRSLDPVDAAEEKLVTALAVAMWNEIRADRSLVETMAEIPPKRPGRSHGTDLHEPEHARSLGTALRYMTAAGMATQRAHRAFLAHRKAKQAGLVLPAAEPAESVNENCTNELRTAAAPDAATECTNEFPPADRRKEAAAPTATGRTHDVAHRPEGQPAATPINRHQRRRLEALARRTRRRAA